LARAGALGTVDEVRQDGLSIRWDGRSDKHYYGFTKMGEFIELYMLSVPAAIDQYTAACQAFEAAQLALEKAKAAVEDARNDLRDALDGEA
jgi:hypothetical protein